MKQSALLTLILAGTVLAGCQTTGYESTSYYYDTPQVYSSSTIYYDRYGRPYTYGPRREIIFVETTRPRSVFGPSIFDEPRYDRRRWERDRWERERSRQQQWGNNPYGTSPRTAVGAPPPPVVIQSPAPMAPSAGSARVIRGGAVEITTPSGQRCYGFSSLAECENANRRPKPTDTGQ